jgi:ABC-type multidrug transport system ATPase subunit
LFNLSATVLDESLILIDEPENSLHPQWQRDYISLVREVIAHARECHVIIATHSPLLVSSLLPSEGIQVHLSKGEKGKIIYSKFEPSAYGWVPGDVLKERFDLETQRPPELAKAINTALSAIRQNDIKSASFKNAVSQIKIFSAVLPYGDPINPVLEAILELSDSPESEFPDA